MGLMAVSLTILTILFLIMCYLFLSQRALNKSVDGAQPLWPLVKPEREGDPSAIMSRRTNTLDERKGLYEPKGSARPAAKATAVATAAATATAKTTTKKPAAKKTAAKKTATAKTTAKPKSAPKTAAKKPAAKPAAKKPAAKKATTKPAGPERLKKPNGKADDLKQISGVGPKLEKTLNGLGFWHFSQIASWKKADVAIVDNELSFKGRIERDDWIKQAKALAKKKA